MTTFEPEPDNGALKAVAVVLIIAVSVLLSMQFCSGQTVAFGQPTFTADKAAVPIVFTDTDTLCAISLKFIYDTNFMAYGQTLAFDTNLLSPANFCLIWADGNQWALSFFTWGAEAITIEDTLCVVVFDLRKSGVTDLTWIDWGGNCDLGDCDGNTWPVSYINVSFSYCVAGIEAVCKPVKHGMGNYDILGRLIK